MDEVGDVLQQILVDVGVEVVLCCSVVVLIGVVYVLVFDDGDNSIIVVVGVNVEFDVDDVVVGVVGVVVVFVQLEVFVESVVVVLWVGWVVGVLMILNVVFVYDVMIELFGDVDVLVVNEIECVEFGGIEWLYVVGVQMVVFIQGVGGVILYCVGDDLLYVDVFWIDLVDMIGVGDVFCGVLVVVFV